MITRWKNAVFIRIFAPNEDVARMAYFGLFALQHRGQEAAGILLFQMQKHVHDIKIIGLIAQKNELK